MCHPRKSRHHTFLSLSRSTRLSIEPSSIGGHSWPCFSWKREQLENTAVFCSVSSALGISPRPFGNQLTLWSMLQQTGAHLHAPESRENLVSACTACQLPKRIPTSGHAVFNNGASLGICCQQRDYTRIEFFLNLLADFNKNTKPLKQQNKT